MLAMARAAPHAGGKPPSVGLACGRNLHDEFAADHIETDAGALPLYPMVMPLPLHWLIVLVHTLNS